MIDVFFKVESIVEEGWNEDPVNLGKRASMEVNEMKEDMFKKYGKKTRIDNVKDGSRSLILEKNTEGNTPEKTALVSLGISQKNNETNKGTDLDDEVNIEEKLA